VRKVWVCREYFEDGSYREVIKDDIPVAPIINVWHTPKDKRVVKTECFVREYVKR